MRLMSVLAMVALVSICDARSARADTEPVKVGALISLSGNWAAIGENVQQGITLATEEVNNRGGVLGRRVEVDFQDTDEEKSGAKVVSGYRYQRSRGIKLFIGPTGVPGLMALTPIAIQDDVLLIGATATNSFYKQSERFFNASGDNYTTTKATAERAFARGSRRAAVFGSLQPWEQAQSDTFKSVFTSLGGTIAAEVTPAADQADLKTEASQLARSGADSVFFGIFNHQAEAAWAMKFLQFEGQRFLSQTDRAHLVGSNGGLEGAEFYLFNAPSAEFVAKYKARFGRNPEMFADSGYDAMLSLSAAIRAAGSDDVNAVAKALSKLSFQGSAAKPLSYDRDGLITRGIGLYRIEGDDVKPAGE